MKVIISQCSCTCGCTSDFKIETGKRGRRPTRCESCRTGQCKPVKITTPNTCGTCGREFPCTRGIQPKDCPECRLLRMQTKAEKEATPDRVLACEECGKEFQRPPTRGRTPKRCPECREYARQATNTDQPKPDNVCRRCETPFPHTGKKGRQPHHCPTCQDKLRQQEPSAQSLHRKGKRRKNANGEHIKPVYGADLWLAVEDMLRARGQLLSQQKR